MMIKYLMEIIGLLLDLVVGNQYQLFLCFFRVIIQNSLIYQYFILINFEDFDFYS